MPKLPSQVTRKIPARKLCRQQQRPRLPGTRNHPVAMYFRYAAMRALPLLKKMTDQAEAGRAAKALGSSRPMGESDPANVRDLTLKAGTHLDMLVRGLVPAGDEETHDYLCHVVGISQIRIMDVGIASRATGGIATANELLLTLNAAAQGLLRARERHGKTGAWGLDDPAIEALRESLDIYEEVLRASSAMQMESAQGARLRALQRQQAQREGVAA
jgi:hypothetical protein